MSLSFIVPNWPAPENVVAGTTTRNGGVSVGPYKSFNLADYVDDQPWHVQQNREHLNAMLNLPAEPVWLKQVHGIQVIDLPSEKQRVADAALTKTPKIICAVMTADCLPVLLCNQQGTEVAAIHAGWKGLAAGVVEATIAKMTSKPEDLLVWLGPAISKKNFEVGEEVFAAFVKTNQEHEAALIKTQKQGYYHADMYLIAQQKLKKLGINAIYGGEYCTYGQEDLFFSHRRDQGITGRMASLIYFC